MILKFASTGAIQRDAAVISHVSPFRFCLFLPFLRWTALIERLRFAASEHENLYRFSHAIVILTLGFCPRILPIRGGGFTCNQSAYLKAGTNS
ncbi:hypothetical protein [Bradyrhizobium barranii]